MQYGKNKTNNFQAMLIDLKKIAYKITRYLPIFDIFEFFFCYHSMRYEFSKIARFNVLTR
jgi:hypothetical protein